jgi:hypothetical protein
VDDLPIAGSGNEQVLQELMARFDAPAYVQRARQVEEAFARVVERCRHQREEWLALVRVRLSQLRALAGHWDRLGALLATDDQVELLKGLCDTLRPQLRLPVEPTSSQRQLRRALAELTESLERFNRRWLEFLREVDLSWVNELRDGYNRYYVLEKECAVRSARIAQQGFKRLKPVTPDDLEALLPPLPVPRVRE